MLAILKADFRRLIHSKGFWTMEILLLAFNFLIVLLAHPTVLKFISGLQGVSGAEGLDQLRLDGLTAVSQAIESGAGIQIFMLFLTLYLVGPELNHQLYKNSLSAGISRFSYYFNKWLMIFLLTGFNLFLYTSTRYLYASLFLDMSGLSPEVLGQGVQVLLLQWLFIQFWVAVILTLLHLTHSIPISLVFFFLFGPSANYLAMLLPKITWLRYVDVQANFALLSNPNLALAVGLSLILSTIFGCLGYQIFKRRDL